MANTSILIGVSGGPDSLCLLDLLSKTEYPIIAATFNHHLRPQSQMEVDLVHQFCEDRHIEFVTGQADVRRYAQMQSLSIEEASRKLRYDFLFHQAQVFDARTVAVAHNADDQVETILMHLLRGAGSTGLAGMQYRSLPNSWSTSIPILRPLLSTWRYEIEQYIEEYRLPASYDQSNTDRRFFRNRLRHDLLPELEKYNPHIRKALWKTALLLSDEQVVLTNITETAWQECIDPVLPDAIGFKAGPFTQLPVAVQRTLLRKAIGALVPGLRDIDFDAVERARKFFQSPSRSHATDLIAGLCLQAEAGKVWLARENAELPDPNWPQLLTPGDKLLDIPGKLLISPNWILQASFQKIDQPTRLGALGNSDPYQAWLDADQLRLPLIVRTRKEGDRFKPLGLEDGTVKLSDFFTDQKLPRRARDRWPLICSGENICWVPGFRSGHLFRLTNETQQTVHLHMKQSSREYESSTF